METTIKAAGRQIHLTGTKEAYLQGLQGMDADRGAFAEVTKDLPEGALCFDVGANIGVTALALAARRPDCRIVAFEPVPENIECLRHNLLLNGITTVEVVEAVVSDKQGRLPITNNGPWSTVAEGPSSVWCRAVTLDDYIDQPVAFVKIDTEGHEPDVFAGAREIFIRHKPLVFAEFSSIWYLQRGFNPLVFSAAIYAAFDVLGLYDRDKFTLPVPNGLAIALANMQDHRCVTDVPLRPKVRLPDLDETVYPAHILEWKRAAAGQVLVRKLTEAATS